MDKLVEWHNGAIYGEPHHNALNIDMASQLKKMTSITYQEYTKLCKKQGVNAMNEETFNTKYDRFKNRDVKL